MGLTDDLKSSTIVKCIEEIYPSYPMHSRSKCELSIQIKEWKHDRMLVQKSKYKKGLNPVTPIHDSIIANLEAEYNLKLKNKKCK